MFGAMFGAAMFGDGDDEDMNDFFMGGERKNCDHTSFLAVS